MNEQDLLILITAMALATFATRVIPFLLLHNHSDHPLLEEIARYAPPAIMSILVIYSIKDTAPHASAILPVVIAIALTVLLHLWRGNALLSTFVGTAAYMLMLQT